MKICHIQQSFYPEIGGMQTNTLKTLKALKAKNQEIYIITGNNKKNSFSRFERLKSIKIFRGNWPNNLKNRKFSGFDFNLIKIRQNHNSKPT